METCFCRQIDGLSGVCVVGEGLTVTRVGRESDPGGAATRGLDGARVGEHPPIPKT